jgi:hypothetical protein
MNSITLQMNGSTMFPDSDTEKYNEHLCLFLVPIAVFKDYSSKEEILSEWENFYFPDYYDPEEEAKNPYGCIEKKYLADYFCNIRYNLMSGIAFFFPITSMWAG